MLEYNTQLKQMILPEYGRTVHEMVEFCLNIPDREERNRCAFSIVKIMANMFPELVAPDGSKDKIWDHVMIMSNFNLDVDFPCDVIRKEALHPVPKPIPYSQGRIRQRTYGKTIERMIDAVAEMPEGLERDQAISMLAHHMKKLLLIHNPEGVDDARVLRDLSDYSGGRINLDPETYILHEFQEDIATQKQQQGKKKKKKK